MTEDSLNIKAKLVHTDGTVERRPAVQQDFDSMDKLSKGEEVKEGDKTVKSIELTGNRREE